MSFLGFGKNYAAEADAPAGAAGTSTGANGLIDVAGNIASRAGGKLVLTTPDTISYGSTVVVPLAQAATDAAFQGDFIYNSSDAGIRILVFRQTSSGKYEFQFDGAGNYVVFCLAGGTGAPGVVTTVGSGSIPNLVNGTHYRVRGYCVGTNPVYLRLSLTSVANTGVETVVADPYVTDATGTRLTTAGVSGLATNGGTTRWDTVAFYNIGPTSTDTTASGDAYEITAPDGITSSTPINLVLIAHGYNGDQTQARIFYNAAPLILALVQAGFVVMAANLAGPSTWGNEAARMAYLSNITKAASLYNVRGLFGYAISMGGLVTARIAIDNGPNPSSIPLRAIAFNSPVQSRQKAHDSDGYASQINIATGGINGSDASGYNATLTTQDPLVIVQANGNAMHNVPVRYYVASDDSTIPPAEHTTPMVAALIAPEKGVHTLSGGHVPLAATSPVELADLTKFFLRYASSDTIYPYAFLMDPRCDSSISATGVITRGSVTGTFYVTVYKITDGTKTGVIQFTVAS